MERVGLGELCSMARNKKFNGGILLALRTEIWKEPNSYKSDCEELGIPAGAIRITLKGKLVALFGTVFLTGHFTIRITTTK